MGELTFACGYRIGMVAEQEGQLVYRVEGALPASDLTKLINEHLFGAAPSGGEGSKGHRETRRNPFVASVAINLKTRNDLGRAGLT